MLRSPCAFLVALLLAADIGYGAFAQQRVQTESIRPPAPVGDPSKSGQQPPATTGSVPAANPNQVVPDRVEPVPELILDLSRLPEPVAKTRERLLAAARSGDLNQLAALMHTSGAGPIFSLNDDKDPIAFWKANYPDSDGVEVLAILIEILESGAVRVDKGTPQDMYVWPYFARTPIKGLSAAQKVELFKIITGTDYKDMLDVGAYNFYRLGISPDGTWQFFVAGD
jgi:hypothetical protein